MNEYPSGLYDLLYTKHLHERLAALGLLDQADLEKLEVNELSRYLAVPLAREIATCVKGMVEGCKREELESVLVEQLVKGELLKEVVARHRPHGVEWLKQIRPGASGQVGPDKRPDTPLSMSALLTGSKRSPSLRSQLEKELETCDRADWLVSFIKFSGLQPLLPVLRKFTNTPLADGQPRLRIATTSYMGATDVKAIEKLLELPNTEVRVSYDTKRTRLHAKAYLFHRESGFGSAYVGSANISKVAHDDGLEWTAKVSQYETRHLWEQAVATFENHWLDEKEFQECKDKDLDTLRNAIAIERKDDRDKASVTYFDFRPFGYQEAILNDIQAEREAGENKHLIIAATGTGKTMISAFDYKRFKGERKDFPRLLFVAHREEILKQAHESFRQVLRDGNFGELIKGGVEQRSSDHLFCTVQSWNSRNFSELDADHFEYVVLDEAHHASASSYRRLIEHVRPKCLLGLTATPERNDGKDIRDDFGAYTHEIRLPEAIERALLCPFHYYGIGDVASVDYSKIEWKSGRYESGQLRGLIEDNESRAGWVLNQTIEHVADVRDVRGLGFCVSVKHAQNMAAFLSEYGIPALALHGESANEERQDAQRRLGDREINFIFTCDLYNEGVDLPFLDTVLFLRPTESLTVFLQQLGRGLRLEEGKSHLTVLDFIAPQHRRFNYASRFRALSNRPKLSIVKQVEKGMTFLPAGCLIQLEERAKDHVLQNIKQSMANLGKRNFERELRGLAEASEDVSLQDIVGYFELESPDEIFKHGMPSVMINRVRGEKQGESFVDMADSLAKGCRKLMLMNDTLLLNEARELINQGEVSDALSMALIQTVLWGNKKPGDGTLRDVQQFIYEHEGLWKDLLELMDWQLAHTVPMKPVREEALTGPLCLHGCYTREQVLLALGEGTFDKPSSFREGTRHVPERKLDMFFSEINKSESDYSDSTFYDDYALSRKVIHWQSQSTTSDTSKTGKRYIGHEVEGYQPVMFLRDRRKMANGLTAPYYYVGPVSYRHHYGSKPISFEWKLKYPLPEQIYEWARRS